MQIKDIQLPSPIIAAPLAGISNAAFRSLLYPLGAGLVVSEMISDKALLYHNRKTLDMTRTWEGEDPLAMQLFGHDVDSMVYGAKYLDTQSPCKIIDINMGCPVKKVLAAKAGSYLMQDVDYAYHLVKTIVENVNKPVTVKMRLGYDMQHINVIEMAKAMEAAGVAMIAIHGRTRSQLYSGQANWDYIYQVKTQVSIPVVGNGDITSVEDGLERLKHVDGIMIGRGLLSNPWLICQINAALNGQTIPMVTPMMKHDFLIELSNRLIKIHGENVAIKEMRTYTAAMISGLPNNHAIKQQVNTIETQDGYHKAIDAYFASLHPVF